ncbi:unnamed protein product [Rhizophagus irregularis]|nr:unnamed protein product [Rhizophagus irregularis]CAB5382642.1 unnamed protein product [Rhizophagus irregularis]
MDTTSAHDSNSDDSNTNESDSDANKSDSDVYFKSNDSVSDNEYDHKFYKRLQCKEMAQLAKLEKKTLSLLMMILIKYSWKSMRTMIYILIIPYLS